MDTNTTATVLTAFQLSLAVGQEVYWNDPDGGMSNGIYEVLRIDDVEGEPRDGDTVIFISDLQTGNEAETCLHEVREVTENDRKVIKIRVTLEIEYPGNGASAADIIPQIEKALSRSMQRDNLLGEPSGYSLDISEVIDAPVVETKPAEPGCFGPDAIPVLTKAESFISGFEDDASQEGVKELLAGLRGQLAKLPPAIVLSSILDGLVAARSVVNEWEGRNLAGAVNVLEGWTTQVSDIGVSDEHPLAYTLAAGFQAAGEVLANWERGDLAGAVQNLEGWIDEANTTLGQMGLLSPISVVWMSGGVVQDVTTVGDARVVLIDTDEAEDVANLPDVPTSSKYDDYAEARVTVHDSGREKDRAWAEEVAALEQISDRAYESHEGSARASRPDRDCDADCTRRQVPAAECDCSRSE